MELFRVTCVTCSAALSVRNQSLIGQIHACPRCGSMVEIAPPAAAGAASASDSRPAPTPAPPPAAESTPAAAFEGAEFDDAGALASAAEAGSDLAAEMPLDVDAASGAHRYQWAAWAVSAACAAAAAIGLVIYSFVGGDSNADPTAVATAGPAEPQSEADLPTQPDRGDSSVAGTAEQVLSEPPSSTEAEAVQVPLAAGDAEAELQASSSTGPPREDASQAEPTLDETRSTPDEASAQPAAAEPANAAPPRRKLLIDPLEVDPEGFDLTLLLASGDADAHPSVARGEDSLVRPEADPVPDRAVPVPADEPDPAQLRATRAPDGGGKVVTADVDRLLSRKFPRVSVEKMPLCEFVDLMTALSGVPVSVSHNQLQLAGVSATRGVSVQATDSSPADVLASGLKKLRLRTSVEGAQVRLRRVGENRERTISLPVDDLVGDTTTLEQLADWVRRLVEPQSWNDGSSIELENGRLRITRREHVQYQVLLFLERLRLVRSMATRSKYPPQLLHANSSYAAMLERLQAPTTFTFSEETALADVVRYWQQELSLPILVDWPALAKLDFWPRSAVRCSAVDQPWHAALDAVLDPLDLAWTTWDGKVLVITTKASAAESPQLEFYPLEAGAQSQPARWFEQLARLAKRVQSAGPSGIFDKKSGALIVRAPAAVQRPFAEWLLAEGILRQSN